MSFKKVQRSCFWNSNQIIFFLVNDIYLTFYLFKNFQGFKCGGSHKLFFKNYFILILNQNFAIAIPILDKRSEIWQNFFWGHFSLLQVSFFNHEAIDERIVDPLLALVKKCEFKLTRMTISRSPAVMTLLGDLNWPFKLRKAIIRIIFLDKKDSPWLMDIIKRKLQKTIWISHFPMTQTVCRRKFQQFQKFKKKFSKI